MGAPTCPVWWWEGNNGLIFSWCHPWRSAGKYVTYYAYSTYLYIILYLTYSAYLGVWQNDSWVSSFCHCIGNFWKLMCCLLLNQLLEMVWGKREWCIWVKAVLWTGMPDCQWGWPPNVCPGPNSIHYEAVRKDCGANHLFNTFWEIQHFCAHQMLQSNGMHAIDLRGHHLPDHGHTLEMLGVCWEDSRCGGVGSI